MTFATDIEWRLSTQSGSAGDSTASTPVASIGKYMATTPITDATLGNLFPTVSPAEATAGVTRYRCLFVLNSGASAWNNLGIWIESQTPAGGTLSVGLDPAGIKAHDSATAQAAVPADELTAPSGVTFSNAEDDASALSIGTLDPDECIAVWAKMVVPAGVEALALDDAILHLKGTT